LAIVPVAQSLYRLRQASNGLSYLVDIILKERKSKRSKKTNKKVSVIFGIIIHQLSAVCYSIQWAYFVVVRCEPVKHESDRYK